MILQHETSPAIALEIMRTRCFIAGPILGDAGLNAFMVDHPRGNYYPDQAEHQGAIIEFEWSGPVSTNTYLVYPKRDVCYDQHPHRAFVFVGNTQHLRIVGLKLKPHVQWAVCVHRPGFSLSGIWPRLQSLRQSWVQKQVAIIEAEVQQSLMQKPFVRIVLPRNAPYLTGLRKCYPDIG